MDQLQGQAREKQRSSADFIERFAGNIREAARAFENDAPFAARGIDSAAEYVEDAAEKIRNGSFRDVVDNATDFAKRQPAAFLGISVLAGFAVVRFLKASERGASSSSRSDTNQASSSRRADAWTSSAPGGSSEHFSRPQQSSSSQRGGVWCIMSIQNNIRESGTALNPGASGQGHREENGAMRTQTGFLESLTSAVRDNPVAAALIGGGALWLLMDSDKLKGAVNSGAAAASPMVDIGARNLRSAASGPRRTAVQPTAPEMDHEGSFRVGDTLREAGNAASDTISGAADKIRDRFDEGVAYARENLGKLGPGKESLAKAQSSLADILERQPLVLGAIGLAIGAAVAGAFRTSDLENEWIGDLSDEVKADLNTRAGAVSQSLRESSDTLKAELSDTGAEAIDRVKQASTDAVDAAREKVKSP